MINRATATRHAKDSPIHISLVACLPSVGCPSPADLSQPLSDSPMTKARTSARPAEGGQPRNAAAKQQSRIVLDASLRRPRRQAIPAGTRPTSPAKTICTSERTTDSVSMLIESAPHLTKTLIGGDDADANEREVAKANRGSSDSRTASDSAVPLERLVRSS